MKTRKALSTNVLGMQDENKALAKIENDSEDDGLLDLTPSSSVSTPAARFQKDARGIVEFFAYVMQNANLLNQGVSFIVSVVQSIPKDNYPVLGLPDDTADKMNDLAAGKYGGPLQDLSDHLPLLYELMFGRIVDNFLNYVSELLAAIFTTRPEMLKSDAMISVREVLEYADRQELIDALTERKVIGLSFKGMTELNTSLAKLLGFPLFANDVDLTRSVVLIEKRNLIAHNRGYVNRHYLARVKDATEVLGSKLTFAPEYIVEELRFLMVNVLNIDKQARAKFTLPAG